MKKKFSMRITAQELHQLQFQKDEEGWLNAYYGDFVMSIYEVKSALIRRSIWVVARQLEGGRGAVMGHGVSQSIEFAKMDCRRVVMGQVARNPGAVNDLPDPQEEPNVQ